MESSYHKSAKDTITFGIASLLTTLIPVVQLPLLTKTLGADNFGLFSQAQATVDLILPLSSLGLGVAMVRFLAAEKNTKEIRKGFYSVVSLKLLISLVIASVIFILAEPLAINFFGGAVQVVKITAALFIAATLEPIYFSLLKVFRQIGKYSIFHLADGYVRLGLITYLVLNGYGLLSVLLTYLAVRGMVIIILSILFWLQIGIGRPDFPRLKEYLKFGLPLVPLSISRWLVDISDRYVIGYFLGVNAVGIYSAAYGLGHIPYMISAMVSFILLAATAKLYDEGKMNEVKTHLRYSLKYLLAIVIPFVFGAAVLAGPVLRLFSTAEIATEGWFVLPIVALSLLLFGVQTIVSRILFLTKNTKILAITWMIAASINLGLNILIVPRMGIIGAAITTLLAYLLALAIISYYSFKEFTFGIEWRFIIKSLVASVIMSLVVWWMAPQGHGYTILAIVTGVVIYSVIIILLKGFTRNEFRFFRDLLKGLLKRGSAIDNSQNDIAGSQ